MMRTYFGILGWRPPLFLGKFYPLCRSSVSVGNEKIKHSRNWNCFYTISLSSIALCQLFMAFLGNVGLVLLIKSLCVLNVAFRVHQNCVYMKIFIYPPIHYTDILQKMKTCILKADDNFNEIYEGLRRTSARD